MAYFTNEKIALFLRPVGKCVGKIKKYVKHEWKSLVFFAGKPQYFYNKLLINKKLYKKYFL